MEFDWKKLARALGFGLMILIPFGGLWFMAFIFGGLGMFPIYVTKTIPVLGIVTMLAAILAVSDYVPPKEMRALKISTLVVCLGCLVYIGAGAYRESIPTLEDRELLLQEYQPFQEDTKALHLDAPASLQLDSNDILHLRLDGATALYPVYSAFVQATYPKRDYPLYTGAGYGQVACSGTVEAYERLLKGDATLIFAAEPSQAQLEAATQAGKEFHLTPIGREAFVFFVNSKNPVTSLTVEEIQGVYSGRITNWAEVGGKRQSIRPFQRAENSGSQTALQSLMAGMPLLEPEEEDRIAGMGGIITQVASYRNYKNALGFSFRYYATEMVQNGDIRLLALNGIAPTRETIRDGSYPIASEFYAITCSNIGTPAPEETHENMAAFLDWIVSEEGQKLVEETGYVAVQ